MRRLPLLVAAVLAAPAAMADDWGSLHLFDTRFNVSKHASLVLHTRFRTHQNFQQFFQYRLGPIATIPLTKHWSAWGGYYYSEQDRLLRGGMDDFHRAFGGAIGRWDLPGRTTLESLTRYERFFAGPTNDYNRYRQRFSWEIPRGRVAPLLTFETLLTRIPLGAGKTIWTKTTFRVQTLLGIRISAATRMRAGYEYRQNAFGPAIHHIMTTFEWTAYPGKR
jgi:hypothetical protein